MIFTSSLSALSCAHEHEAHGLHALYIEWALSIGVATVANKKALFVTLKDHVPRFEAY